MLKSGLSHYLESTRRGEEIVVTAHKHPVARLIPYVEADRIPIVRPTLSSSTLKRISGVAPLRPCDPVQSLLTDRKRR